MKFGWYLLCTLFSKRSPHLGVLNMYFEADIATLYIRSNEELVVFYSVTLSTQNKMYISKAIIYPKFIIKRYLEFLISCSAIITSLSGKQASFTNFMSTNGNYVI